MIGFLGIFQCIQEATLDNTGESKAKDPSLYAIRATNAVSHKEAKMPWSEA